MESTDDAIPMKVSSCFRKIELPSGLDTQFCSVPFVQLTIFLRLLAVETSCG